MMKDVVSMAIPRAFLIIVACAPATVRAQEPASITAHELDRQAVPERTAGPDVVELSSGNRMTGTLQSLERGELSFGIDGAGTVAIAWGNVEALQSTQRLDIELSSGERLSGSISAAPADTLHIVGGGASRAVAIEDVVRITPIGATVRQRTTGSIDVGLAFLDANEELDLTLNGEVANRTRNVRTEASLSLLVRHLADETAQRRNHFEVASRVYGAERWFALGAFELEENRKMDIDLRALVGAAPGRTLLQTGWTMLSAHAGVDYLVTRYRGAYPTERFPEALAAVEWDVFGRGTELSIDATTYAALRGNRTRFELDSRLHRDILGRLYWSVNFYHSYDSAPPPDVARSDFAVTLGIGRAF